MTHVTRFTILKLKRITFAFSGRARCDKESLNLFVITEISRSDLSSCRDIAKEAEYARNVKILQSDDHAEGVVGDDKVEGGAGDGND